MTKLKTQALKIAKITGRTLLIIIATPLLFAVFFADRIGLIFLFWLYCPNMKEWSESGNHQFYSLIRLGTAGLIYLIYILGAYVIGSGAW